MKRHARSRKTSPFAGRSRQRFFAEFFGGRRAVPLQQSPESWGGGRRDLLTCRGTDGEVEGLAEQQPENQTLLIDGE